MNVPTHEELLDELYDLCEVVLEGDLSEAERLRLETLVCTHAELRTAYVEYMHAHATMTWWNGVEPAIRPVSMPAAVTALGTSTMAASTPSKTKAPKSAPVHPRRPFWQAAMESVEGWYRELTWQQAAPFLVSCAVMLVAGVILGSISVPQGVTAAAPPVVYVATLESAKDCRWENSALPTVPGARLPAGRVRLAEGIAVFTFDDGAKVTLEAPAELELTNAGECRLNRGKLIALVPPPAVGFTVGTPMGRVIDLGTEFGLAVKPSGVTDVQVFEGAVNLIHAYTGQKQRLSGGQAKRLDTAGSRDFDPLVAEAGELVPPSTPTGPGVTVVEQASNRLVNLSTSEGRGRDAYVQSSAKETTGPETLLLVKNSLGLTHRRKAYMAFDLEALGKTQIQDARLELTIMPSNLGFASSVPDATFVLYGLRDESRDGWDESKLDWANAPANLRGGAEIDKASTVRLGAFQINQGVRSGTRSIGGPALVDFLKQDTNGVVTFILVRETLESGGAGLVHGFASRHHPSAEPPTLKLVVRP